MQRDVFFSRNVARLRLLETSRFVGCLVGGPAVDGALDDAVDL